MKFSIEVPATLSNFGPGFDVLGMAVDLVNRFHVEADPSRTGIQIDGSICGEDEHLFVRTLGELASATGGRLRSGLIVRTEERVPRSRGLGSSATVRVAAGVSWLRLAESSGSAAEVLQLVCEAEGHPDNATAAWYGGWCASVQEEGRWHSVRFEPPAGLEVALCVPEVEVQTDAARGVLPASYARQDVVFNSSRLAMLVAGLCRGDASLIRLGQHDRIHQPFRAPLIGPAMLALDAARTAGATAAFISGSGSTLAALCLQGHAAQAAEAMRAVFERDGTKARAFVLPPRSLGACPNLGNEPR